MADDDVENLMLPFMRRLDQRLDRMQSNLGDIKLRAMATVEYLASIMMSVAGLNSRMDKIDGRLGRLDLMDAR